MLISSFSQVGVAEHEPILLGAIVVLGAFLTHRLWPRSPSALIGVALAVGVGEALGWRGRAVGLVSIELPPLASFRWAWTDVTEILPRRSGWRWWRRSIS